MLHISSDPRSLNQSAWSMRWNDRRSSEGWAEQALLNVGATESGYLEAGRALRTLAWQAKWRGDLAKSMNYCTQALGFLEKAGGFSEMADIHSILGVIHIGHVRMDLAQEAVQAGYACLEKQDTLDARVDLMTTDAFVHIHRGNAEAGFAILDAADKMAEGMQVTRLPQNFARLHMYCGQHAHAEAQSRKGIKICKEANNNVVLPYIHEILGNALAARGAKDDAEHVLKTGIEAANAEGDLRAKCQLYLRLGQLLLHACRYEEARHALVYSMRISRVLGYQLLETRAQSELITVYEAMGDTEAMAEATRVLGQLEGQRKA